MDQVFKETKSCGLFQAWMIITTSIGPSLGTVGSMMFMAFGNYNPGWTCLPKKNASQTLNSAAFNEATAWNVTVGGTSREPGSFMEEFNNTKRNGSVPATCGSMNLCEAVDFQGEASTIVTEWGLVCDKDWIPSLIISIQMAGFLVGSMLAGKVGDRWGRKIALFGHVAVLVFTNIVSVFSSSWQVFVAIRFFMGVGGGGALSMTCVYPYEFLTNKWRANLALIPTWNVGSTFFAFLIWQLRDWRHLHLASAAMAALAFLPVFCTPESLRWSAVKGRLNEAVATTKMIARMNRTSEPSLEDMKRILKEVKPVTSTPSYWTLFKDSMWVLTLRVGFLWMCLSILYYVIVFGVKALSGDFYVNLIFMQSLGIVEGFLAGPVARFLGRKWGFGLFMFLTTLGLVAVVILDSSLSDEQSGRIITGITLATSVFLLAAWSIVIVYTAELFPTVVRALGTAFANMCSRVGGILAPVLIPRDSVSLFVPFAIMAAIGLIDCVIILSLSETKGKLLQDKIGEKRAKSEKILAEVENGDGFDDRNSML